MDTGGDPSAPALLPLDPGDRIEVEMIVGPFGLSHGEGSAAIDLPSIDGLMRGVKVIVPTLEGDRREDDALKRRVSDELARLLGGWFARDLTPFIELFDSLVSEETREYYRAGGMTIDWDEAQSAFYSFAFQIRPWLVQAVGEPGVFHCVCLAHLLDKNEAIVPTGRPRPPRLDSIESLLADIAPRLAQSQLVDCSADYTPNVFDTCLKGDGFTVKAGVRLAGTRRSSLAGEATPYAMYAIRINYDLRPRTS